MIRVQFDIYVDVLVFLLEIRINAQTSKHAEMWN